MLQILTKYIETVDFFAPEIVTKLLGIEMSDRMTGIAIVKRLILLQRRRRCDYACLEWINRRRCSSGSSIIYHAIGFSSSSFLIQLKRIDSIKKFFFKGFCFSIYRF